MKALIDKIMLHSSYVRVFETPDGQEVLKHICKVAHVFSPTFVAGDPHQTSLNEGKRLLALSILKCIGQDHSKLVKMIEEQTNEANDE